MKSRLLKELIRPAGRKAGDDTSHPVFSATKYAGFVPSSDYFKKQVFSRDLTRYKRVVKGDFAYATIHLDEGSIGIAPADGLISPMYTVFRPMEELVDPAYLLRYLRRRRRQPRCSRRDEPAFLLSGYLFYWVVIGVVLMGTQSVIGGDFYRSLRLDWHTDLLGDQRLGGGIAWAAGEVPLVVVLVALLVQWRRSDQRTAKRLDRAADRDDDADLVAYNRMLAELARRESRRSG